jgi:hypothetical protein
LEEKIMPYTLYILTGRPRPFSFKHLRQARIRGNNQATTPIIGNNQATTPFFLNIQKMTAFHLITQATPPLKEKIRPSLVFV